MSRKITEQFVKAVPKPGTGNMYVWDAAANGFGIRITATGKKSFVLAYRIGGRQRRYTIGAYPDFSVEAAKTEAGRLRSRDQERHRPPGEQAPRPGGANRRRSPGCLHEERQ